MNLEFGGKKGENLAGKSGENGRSTGRSPSPIDRSLRTPHGHGDDDDDDDDGGLAAAAPPTSMNRRRAAAHANAMHRLYSLTLTPLHQ